MATIVTTTKTCDITGSTENVNTYTFPIAGDKYTIDLADSTYMSLLAGIDQAYAPIFDFGVRVANRSESSAIRNWAIENGVEVSTRGRISSEVIAAYNLAMSE